MTRSPAVKKRQTFRSSLFSLYPAFHVYLWWSKKILRWAGIPEEESKNATSYSLGQDMFRPSVLVVKPVLYQTGTIFLLHFPRMLSLCLLVLMYSLLS